MKPFHISIAPLEGGPAHEIKPDVWLGAALIFVATHGIGLISAGMNVDDWVHLAGQTGWIPIGRYGMEVIHRYAFGLSFVTGLQIAGAFLCLLASSWMLVPQRLTRSTAAMLLVFAGGTSFPYFVDALNFSAHVFGYPLSLALGLAAFRFAGRWKMLLPCALAFAVSASVYQSFALFGAFAVAMRLIDVSEDLDWRYLLQCALVFILGFALYKAGDHLAHWISGYGTDPRFRLLPMSDLIANATAAPAAAFRAWSGRYLFIPETLGLALGLAAAAAAILGLATALMCALEGHRWAAFRVVLGVVILPLPVVAPGILVAGIPPSRALAPLGFALPALALALPHLWPRRLVTALALGTLVPTMILTSAMWTDQAEAARRDRALASSMAGLLASLPQGVQPRVVGTRTYDELWWGNSVGMSAFQVDWGRQFIFRDTFGKGIPGGIGAPFPCHAAYPQPGSIQKTETGFFVCLQETEIGFSDMESCPDLHTRDGVDICALSHGTIVRADRCGPRDRYFQVFSFEVGEPQLTAKYLWALKGAKWRGQCYWAVSTDKELRRVQVGKVRRQAKHKVRWHEDIMVGM